MSSARIRPPVRKSRQEAHEGTRPFAKPKKRAKYSSYLGELSPAVLGLLNRDFSADRPFEKIVTDITEFALSDGKVCLSPRSTASMACRSLGR